MEAAPHPWPALGVLLLRDGLVSKDDLEEILSQQLDDRQRRLSGRRLGEILVQSGRVTPEQVARLVAEQYELPFVDFDVADLDSRAARVLSEDDARRFSAVAVSRSSDGTYLLAIADPSTVLFSDELRRMLGSAPRFAVVGPGAIEKAIEAVYGRHPAHGASTTFDPASVIDDKPDREAILLSFPASSGSAFELLESRLAEAQLTQTSPLLGALLVRDGLLSEADLDAALAQQRLTPDRRLGEILVEKGLVSPSAVARLIAEQYELRFFDLGALDIDPATARRLPEETARRMVAVPIAEHENGSLDVAISDPTRAAFSDELHDALGVAITVVMASPDAISDLLDRIHAPAETETETEAEALDTAPLTDSETDFLEDPAETDESVEVESEMPSVAFVLDAFAKPWHDEPSLTEGLEPEQPEDLDVSPEPELTHLLFDGSSAMVLDEPADDESSWTSRLALVDDVVGEDPEAMSGELIELARPEVGELRNADVIDEAPRDHVGEEHIAEVTEEQFPDVVPSEDAEPDDAVVLELVLPPTVEVVETTEQPSTAEDHEPPGILEDTAFEGAEVEAEADVYEFAWPEVVDAVDTVEEEKEDEPDETAEETFDDVQDSDAVAWHEQPTVIDAEEAVRLDIFGIGSLPVVETGDEADQHPDGEQLETLVAEAADDVSETDGESPPISPSEPAPLVFFPVHGDHPEVQPQELATEPEVEPEDFVEVEIEPEPELSVEVVDEFTIAVEEALAAGASALHFSPHGDELAVRARVDGLVRNLGTTSAGERDALVERLVADGVARAHVVATSRGEKTTVFVRERVGAPRSIEDLGADPETAAALRLAFESASGAILVCGPSDSGRTTTLYAALEAIASPDRVVTTVEHPIERDVEGVDQVEVDPASGVTHATALRELRLADVDAVVVGDLPDREAVEAALETAYEGRLVVAGFTAPSATAAVRRIVDLGVGPKTLAGSARCIVSQRLVRTVCPDCRETYYASDDELAALGQPANGNPRLLVRSSGCTSCHGTGFRGRTAIFEVMPVTDDVRDLVADGASAKKIQKAAVAAGMRTLREEGVRLCLDGLTTVTEVVRVLRDDL